MHKLCYRLLSTYLTLPICFASCDANQIVEHSMLELLTFLMAMSFEKPLILTKEAKFDRAHLRKFSYSNVIENGEGVSQSHSNMAIQAKTDVS